VVLAAGDAAGFRLRDGDDGGHDFVGVLGDGAEGLGLGCCRCLWCDLAMLLVGTACLNVWAGAYCDCLGLGER
jgi:hypothetical protein